VHADRLTNVKVSKKTARREDSKARHTYFCAPEVASDIILVIKGTVDPSARGLTPRKHRSNGWCIPTKNRQAPLPSALAMLASRGFVLDGTQEESGDSEEGKEDADDAIDDTNDAESDE